MIGSLFLRSAVLVDRIWHDHFFLLFIFQHWHADWQGGSIFSMESSLLSWISEQFLPDFKLKRLEEMSI
jgi:hypothetical protein